MLVESYSRTRWLEQAQACGHPTQVDGPGGPMAPVWGARRPELVQPAGATVALHEHSEVRTAKWLGSFFFNMNA